MAKSHDIVPVERIVRQILFIRDLKVILDSDLATLYGVTTARLNEQVKRNKKRFPSDFVFQLTKQEFKSLMSQIATSKGRGGRRKPPHVFTEHGAIMAASVLNTEQAVEASIYVVRAFVELRRVLTTQKELAHKLNELEQRLDTHDEAINSILTAIRALMEPPEPKRKQIGFKPKKRKS
jgi:hypothetical protein